MASIFGYDKLFLQHDTGVHPERPERLLSIVAELKRRDQWQALLGVSQRVEPDEWIRQIHGGEYINRLDSACREGRAYIDEPDSVICPESFEVARQAVSLTLAACDMIVSDVAVNGFCALRPPGHHAEYDRSMGFCLFNNVAVACRYLQRKHGFNKILILDWDVHHGNGTQHTFENDATVFFCSLHQHPATCYPGTGWPKECGAGGGRGYTLNLPMGPGAGDRECCELFEHRFLPVAREFDPDFVLISAGFDGHHADPLAQLDLSEQAYNHMTYEIKALAEACCKGRLLSLLEGGYDLPALSGCVASHLKILMK